MDSPDLSGVATDGSAAIWIGSSSGRRWSKITGKDNTLKTVTVEDAYANTEAGKNWGIGGKRLSLDGSTQLGLDVHPGWTIDIQTDQTTTAAFRIAYSGLNGLWMTLTSTTGAKIQTATNSLSGVDLGGALGMRVSKLTLLCTAGTPGDGITQTVALGSNYVFTDLVIDGFRRGIDGNSNFLPVGTRLNRVTMQNCTWEGIDSEFGSISMDNCKVLNCNTAGGGAHFGAKIIGASSSVRNSIFKSNNFCGLYIEGGSVVNNVFRDTISGPGLNIGDGANATAVLKQNTFWNNSTYGVVGGANFFGLVNEHNAYGSNGTADIQNLAGGAGTGDVTLTADPATSSTDEAPNATAGGGPILKGAGAAWLGSAATAPDIGAIQVGEGGAGGGVSRSRLQRGM